VLIQRSGGAPQRARAQRRQTIREPFIWPCVFALLLAGAPAGRAAADGAAAQPSTRVVMLGSGTPQAESTRSGPAVAVVVGDRPYLVDFGPGVVRQASRAVAQGIAALAPARLGTAFATHLHSDHTTGLADLALAPWVLGRDVPLALYGPPGVASMAAHITSAYADDIDMRVNPPSFRPRSGAQIEAHEVQPGLVLQTPDVRVEAFPVEHGTWKHAYGYRFQTAERSIVISGDTRPSQALIEKARGCDVLVHEAYLKSGYDGLGTDQQAYHGASHTSGIELGRLAATIRPGLLVVYHTLLFGGSPTDLMREIKSSFDGDVVIADDLDVF
jgi:ribonuclease BN (tRNA processing enzyme)